MRYDVVIAGGGHNGLVAAAYLARAGRTVLLLERLDHLGGLAVSARPFEGVDARLSRYSYLVSLLPSKIINDLGLPLRLLRRRYASYTPVAGAGLLVDGGDRGRTQKSFAAVAEHPGAWQAWQDFYAMTDHVAQRVASTLLEPLRSRAELSRLIGDATAWSALFERPIGEVVHERFPDDVIAGVVLTDALIGTFTDPDDPSLLANRCLLYHVIGNGTGEWNVPVGGMGAVTDGLATVARQAGAELRTGAEVTHIDGDSGEVTFLDGEGTEHTVEGGHVLMNLPPSLAASALGTFAPVAEGSQLKVNMVLSRLPALRDPSVRPEEAFSGTFHVNEARDQLATAFSQASSSRIPDLPPAEVYCHSLTDPSILGPDLREAGAQTLTLFGLHMPTRLFHTDPAAAKEHALRATLASLNSVLAEPIEDCLLRTPTGELCLEVKTPVDLEHDAALPGGHIFHQDLQWPYAEHPAEQGNWGVETTWSRVLLCGASAKRGGGVSGIPGHNAAMALLTQSTY
ncbi:phytoene desaturase family protein [Spirillospora sp. CA-294931]|uniref:phytoene desaturase family protein n=1 Tax=Spirillospora sp. CA-294931 TaxID=3240042 RepID=UPI003D8D1C67